MKRLLALALVLAAVVHAQAQSPQAAEFAWRAELSVPPGASLVRASLPADALAQLQSPAASDVRLFDADGKPLTFSLAAPPAQAQAPRELTPAFAALPLFGAGARPSKGAVQVRVQEGGEQRSVWVDLKPGADAAAPAARRLPSALFDTRAERRAITALVLRTEIGPNRPVRFTASTSADLASWTLLPLSGRIYRFEGEGAPANDTLRLAAPVKLEGRYLRLEWQGEEAVVHAMSGVIEPATPAAQRLAFALPAPRADGMQALEWPVAFATPIVELALTTETPNTLLPLRVLGRNRASEPWHLLGHTVVWRLGTGDAAGTNPPMGLGRPSVRWLRVEATHGARLDGAALKAQVAFDPLQVVFVAGGKPPYTLAAGRADTAVAALPLGMLAAASGDKLDALPAAKLSPAITRQPEAPSAFAQKWLPQGFESRTAILWAVLGGGVLLLGGVAWSLLRQLDSKDAGSPPPQG